ncbi:MAG: alcohol dehydrogenase catalytic domain-containing protein [Rhizobiales bacterium]|nr:alcohol dehydrogenase catalytic domain-containing protein [Hyphomicrobiales bacterium]
MRSFQVRTCSEPLQCVETTTPQPQGTEVLLRVLAAGVCHSDLHIWDGFYDIGGGKRINLTDRGVTLPLTMGHENVGEVVAVGPDAEGVRIGDRRIAFPWMGCGTCAVCRREEEQLCPSPRFLGVFRAGGYSDHLLMPHPRYLVDYGDIPAEQAAPLACSGVTTYGALKKLGWDILEREAVVIVGAGGLGLMGLSILKAMKGRGAIALDIDARKREAAMQAGALAAIDPAAPDAQRQIVAAAGGALWAAVDLVGSSSTVQLCVNCLTKGGALIVVGLYGGEVTIPTPFLPLRALTLRGSYTGSLGELKELVALVGNSPLPYVPMRVRPLDEANSALADLKAGRVIGRQVLGPAER